MDIRYIWGRFFKKLHGSSVKNSTIHRFAKINAGSQVVDTNIGRFSFCGYDCQFINCSIGAFCSISSQVIAGGHSHPMDWASTSPVFYAGRDSVPVKFAKHDFHESHPLARTTIGSDVWIGSNVIIKAGVTIGNGAIVGMGSVVVKDIPDYAIVAGNPAKLIRMRFDSDTVEKLLKTRWWDLPDEEIKRLAPYATDVEKFVLYAESFVFSQNYYLANKNPPS